MARVAGLSNREARWLAIAAQGLGAPLGASSARRPGLARLGGLLAQVGTIQLDAVNVLERTQYLVPFSRLGAYDRGLFARLTGPGRPWFEYWGHAASLLPVELYPLFRPRMERLTNDAIHSPASERRRRNWRAANATYLEAVLAEIEERGALAASQLTDPRRRLGEWWDRRSDGRVALEMLFTDGVLAAWRTANFERVYDLARAGDPPRGAGPADPRGRGVPARAPGHRRSLPGGGDGPGPRATISGSAHRSRSSGWPSWWRRGASRRSASRAGRTRGMSPPACARARLAVVMPRCSPRSTR